MFRSGAPPITEVFFSVNKTSYEKTCISCFKRRFVVFMWILWWEKMILKTNKTILFFTEMLIVKFF